MDIIATDGSILRKWVSSLDRRRFSLKNSFALSARVWRTPKGLTYSCPICCCSPVDISLSNHTITNTFIAISNLGVKIGTRTDTIS